MNAKTLKQWLEDKYLDYQREYGRISLKKWSAYLGVNYSYLMNLMNGDQPSTSMQTAYQIGEKLDDFSIMEVFGYPIPDAPLVGLDSAERAVVLDWLEYVKMELDKVPDAERMKRLNEILAELPDADSEAE